MAKVWKQIGSPLRPTEQDIKFLTDEIHAWAEINGAPRALILGVTPELYSLPWPEKTQLLAADHTLGMINIIWPGPRNSVIYADWLTLPLQTASRDIVLCDGGVHLLDHPNGHRQLVEILHRVLAPKGQCIFRLFTPPKKQESVEEVLKDLIEAKIPNLNILKLRLGMALQKSISGGVALKNVWETLHEAAPDFERLAKDINWPLEHLLAVNTYHNSPSKYYFIDVDDVKQLFCQDPGGFSVESIHNPSYELGERCPTVVLRRKDTLG